MKDERLQIRISKDLKDRVEAEADRRGQKITTFVERALESALGGAEEPVHISGRSAATPSRASNPLPSEPPEGFAVPEKLPKGVQRGVKPKLGAGFNRATKL
jgi:hypothetical protein